MIGVLAAPAAVPLRRPWPPTRPSSPRSGTISPPSIEYSQLAPMLIVFGAAVVGVLVEAFVPRPFRRTVHLILALGSLAAAFIMTIVIAGTHKIFADGSPGHIAAMGRSRSTGRPCSFRERSWCLPS